ncbi:MAG: ABC transporter permease [Phenylobacterium sp.]|uniref:ABC transporter permease n=1 Tax=Phenylobacterium sp. TaxID=1871053 RepID=UPI0025E9C543|nr:ABC transporter permease [Phenylobacterium sp.]MBA4011849.1 ABC transporter permease [Phenylobacterium sp.]
MRFAAAFIATWRAILTHRAAFAILILATVAYGFYYPLAYQHQTATQMPLAVVDLDHSGLSRRLIADLGATEGVRLARVTGDFAEARGLLERRKIDGIVLIPADLERGVLTGTASGGLAIYVNGAYLVRASTIGSTLKSVLSGAVESALQPAARAIGLQTLTPIEVVVRPMFNTREGYGSYAVSGVAILIVHQTLLFGVVMLAADRRQALLGHVSTPGFFGVLAAFGVLGLASTLFYVGFVFWFQDYPRGGNFAGMLAATALYVPAVVLMALLVGSYFDRPERSTQVLVSISAPLFFLSGLSWPHSAMPGPLVALAWAVPSTPGILAMIKLNQMGAHLREVTPELLALATQGAVYGALAYRRWTRPGRASATASENGGVTP